MTYPIFLDLGDDRTLVLIDQANHPDKHLLQLRWKGQPSACNVHDRTSFIGLNTTMTLTNMRLDVGDSRDLMLLLAIAAKSHKQHLEWLDIAQAVLSFKD